MNGEAPPPKTYVRDKDDEDGAEVVADVVADAVVDVVTSAFVDLHDVDAVNQR